MEKSKEEEVKKATFKTLKLVTLPSTEMKSNLNQIKNQSRDCPISEWKAMKL